MIPSLYGDGRVALITGAASGIGLGVSRAFVEAGYRVLLVDINPEYGHAAAQELGDSAAFVAADVGDPDQVENAVAMALKLWDGLDYVFNNAGILEQPALIEDLDEQALDQVLQVNLKGPFYMCKYAVRAMKPRGGGSILNMASITAEEGNPYFPAYTASKAGVIALTRALARKLGRYRIRINCLKPGSVEGTQLAWDAMGGRDMSQTERLSLLAKIPLARIAQAEDIANIALFLASPAARHIHGSILTVDGGESPGYK